MCGCRVWRVVFMVGTKALFDGKLERDAARERNQDRVLGEMIAEFEECRRADIAQFGGEQN
jgi:hypothetical protein